MPLATSCPSLSTLSLPGRLEKQAGECLKCQKEGRKGRLQVVFMGNQNNKGKLPLNTEIKIATVQEVLPAEGYAPVPNRHLARGQDPGSVRTRTGHPE